MTNHFLEFTLTNWQLRLFGVIFSIILVIIGLVGVFYFDNIKKRAWIISLVNSFVTMIAGGIYLYNRVPYYPELLKFESTDISFYTKLDDFSVLASLWFGLACFFDLFFGVLFYRETLSILTCYVHHIVFMWIMLAGTTGYGIFLTCTPFAPSFVYMLIEEVPTFLLALGSVYPQFRTDYGFGSTFFLLRLVYHFYHLTYAVKNKVETVVIVLYTLSGLLHLNWFYGWVRMMLKPKKASKGK